MVEHNRSFLEQIYITNPSQYSTNPEQVGPSIGEKAAQKGNEEFDRLLDEFVNISESVLSKEEKIRQLNELSLQISAEQNRRNKQQLRPDNGEESTKKELMQAVDFDPILQMIDGEMRTLQEGGKEPPKSEEKKSDLEYLKDKVDVVREQIDSGSIDFSNIDTFEKILKLLEQGLEKIESNVSLAGDVNLVTRQGEVDALRKSINELRIAFIQKWKENNPVLQAFITRFEEVSKKVKDTIENNKRGITLTTHFAELESEFKALEQERGKLPKEYQDALAEYVTNRNALKESVVKSWLEWADSDPKSRFAALRTFIEDKRKAHIVGNDVITQAVLDEVSAAQASWKDYKTQAPHFDEQLAYIDARIAELTQLSEELKNKIIAIEVKKIQDGVKEFIANTQKEYITDGKEIDDTVLTKVERQIGELTTKKVQYPQIENQITELQTLLAELKKVKANKEKEEKNKIEQAEREKKEYESLKKDIEESIESIEGDDWSGENLEDRMSEIGEKIKRLGEIAKNATQQAELVAIKTDFNSRWRSYLTFVHFRPVINAVGPDGKIVRDPLQIKYDEKHIWISGQTIWESINGGIEGVSNIHYAERTVKMATGETVKYTPTAFGEVMRFIDNVYRGKEVLKKKDGKPITVDVVSFNNEDLIDGVALKLRIPRIVVRNAFRLHQMVPMHQSYLGPEEKGKITTPQVSDGFYQAWDWWRYFVKYMGRDTDQYLRDLTLLTFGPDNPDYHGFLSDEKERKKLEKKLRERGYLDSKKERFLEKGFANWSWFLRGYLIPLNSREIQETGLGYTFMPPMAYLTTPDNALLSSTMPPADGERGQPRKREFLDYVDENGNVIWELLPFNLIGEGDFRKFFKDLNSGVMPVLNGLFKANPSKIAGFSKEDFRGMANNLLYAMPLLRIIGHMDPDIVHPEFGKSKVDAQTSFRKRIQFLTVLSVIIDRYRRSSGKDGHWGEKEINAYLRTAREAGFIDEEDVEIIKLIGIDFSELFFTGLGDTLVEQLKKSA